MNKHTNYDLAQMQSLPLRAKIQMTNSRIKAWYEYYNGAVYVAVSGGKDSQVLLHLVKKLYPDVEAVFCKTGLEFDSVNKIGERSEIILRPRYDFATTIKKFGYPVISKTVSHQVGIAQRTPNGKVAKRYFSGEIRGSRFDCSGYKWLIDAPFKISDQCCNIMKKQPSHDFSKSSGKKCIVGTMADESQIRYRNWLKYGCNAFETKNPTSQPLSFWTEQDILQYISENDIEIASVYGDIVQSDGVYRLTGEQRTGCVFCMYGINSDTDRFVRLKTQEPLKYDYIMRGGKFNENGMWEPYQGLGYKFVIDWLNEHGKTHINY